MNSNTRARRRKIAPTRQILRQLRDQGVMMGGPAPFAAKDRSLFLQQLDQMIRAIKRGA